MSNCGKIFNITKQRVRTTPITGAATAFFGIYGIETTEYVTMTQAEICEECNIPLPVTQSNRDAYSAFLIFRDEKRRNQYLRTFDEATQNVYGFSRIGEEII